MAKKGSGRGGSAKTSKKASAAKEEQKLTVVPSYNAPFPSFYANYASVTHTASEIFIDCCVMGMPYNVNLEEAQVLTPVVARVILPPAVASGLVTALQAQTEKQKITAQSGTVSVPSPKSGE
ncbi:MAG TPA: DUF3467 domain-containing protein [Pyrinomonadaceae bacterium]|jgi:hypothetical protein